MANTPENPGLIVATAYLHKFDEAKDAEAHAEAARIDLKAVNEALEALRVELQGYDKRDDDNPAMFAVGQRLVSVSGKDVHVQTLDGVSA